MADIQHATLTDSLLHYPKGSSTAANNTWLKANGDGTTTFSPLPDTTLVVVDEIQSQSDVNQVLNTVDTELQVAFGTNATSPNGAVTIDSSGNVTFNQSGLYYINVRAFAGRSSSQGSSTLGFAGRTQAGQVGTTVPATLDAAADGVNVTIADTSIVYIPAGTVYSYHMRLFANGGGDNGIFATALSTTGWNDIPSSRISIRKLEAQ